MESFASCLVKNLEHAGQPGSATTIGSLSGQLLRRAEFFELHRLQRQYRSSFRSLR